MIEATALRVFQREGYRVARAAGATGATTVLEGKNHRALVRFLWGGAEGDWGDQPVKDFRIQMEDLQASRGYLISNILFSDTAKEAAIGLGISLTDGPTLQQTLYDFAPPTDRLRRKPEKPLPFERYIPWFVGISLAVIAIVVLLLISVALALGPVEPGA
jgi:hypothetical protein